MSKSILLLLVLLLCVPLVGCKSKTKRFQPANDGLIASPAPSPGPAIAYEPPPAPDPMYVPGPTRDEFESLVVEVDGARNRAAAAETIANEQASEIDALRRENESLQDEVERLGTPPAGPSPIVETGPTTASVLAGDLRSMGGLEVIEDGGMVVVRVTDAFRSGSEKLKGDTRLLVALRDAASALTRHPGATVAVVGHSDTQPIRVSGWDSNTELSLARAKTVAGVLADNGVQASRIAVDGRGEMEPLIAPERSAADRARNRRVEIMIRF